MKPDPITGVDDEVKYKPLGNFLCAFQHLGAATVNNDFKTLSAGDFQI